MERWLTFQRIAAASHWMGVGLALMMLGVGALPLFWWWSGEWRLEFSDALSLSAVPVMAAAITYAVMRLFGRMTLTWGPRLENYFGERSR
jgi:multisubunit Na+/H+ antiporter MnhB subunit